jgi:hypothetical protein
MNGLQSWVANNPAFLFQKYRRAAWGGTGNLLLDLMGQTNLNDNVSPERVALRQKMAAGKLLGVGTSIATVTALTGALRGLTGDDSEEKRLGGFEHTVAKAGEMAKDVATGNLEGAAGDVVNEATLNPLVSMALRARGGGDRGRLDVNPAEEQEALQAIKRGDIQSYAESARTNAGNSAKALSGSANFSVPSVVDALQGTKDPLHVAANLLLGGKEGKTPAEQLALQALATASPKTPPLAQNAGSKVDVQRMRVALKQGNTDMVDALVEQGRIPMAKYLQELTSAELPREERLALLVRHLDPVSMVQVYENASQKEKRALDRYAWSKLLNMKTDGNMDKVDQRLKLFDRLDRESQ